MTEECTEAGCPRRPSRPVYVELPPLDVGPLCRRCAKDLVGDVAATLTGVETDG